MASDENAATDQESNGIPTLLSVDHFGISVPDLDEAIEFFVEVLNAEVIYRATPPIDDDVQDWMERNLGVHPDSTMRLSRLRCGPTTNVELLDYEDPTQEEKHPTNSDNGASHLCFFVEDIHEAVAYLETVPDVEVQGEVRYTEEGPEKGQEFVYFTTPWGYQMELIHTPEDVAYKAETDARAFGPAPDWDARPQWTDE